MTVSSEQLAVKSEEWSWKEVRLRGDLGVAEGTHCCGRTYNIHPRGPSPLLLFAWSLVALPRQHPPPTKPLRPLLPSCLDVRFLLHVTMSAMPRASTWVADPRNKLHVAADYGSLTDTKAILSRGSIDVNQVDPDGWTPVMVAAERGFASIVRVLVDNGADVSTQAREGTTALISSAQRGHLAVVQTLLAGKANPRAATHEGFTALHVAASDGHSRVVKALLEAGADCDQRMPNGVTPLYLASMYGHLGAVRELLRVKADPQLARATSSWERGIPLDVAAQNGHTEVVREFIQQLGVRACGGPSRGVEAFRLAARFRQLGIMAMLVDAGVVDTGPALSCAAAYGSEAALKFLLRQQEPTPAYLNARDHSNRTPAYCSVSFCSPNSPRVLRLLIDAGADVTSPVEVLDGMWRVESRLTPLAITKLNLREKKVKGEHATEEQLHRLEAMRRLLLQLDAVHAVSWLWPSAARVTALGGESTGEVETTPTVLMPTLPLLRRRATRRGLSLAAVFR